MSQRESIDHEAPPPMESISSILHRHCQLEGEGPVDPLLLLNNRPAEPTEQIGDLDTGDATVLDFLSITMDSEIPFPNVLAAPEPAQVGTRPTFQNIDRYQLIEVIGKGGMGSVWRARQTDPVDREVAIKMLHSSMESPAMVERFLAERQTLARMNHPGISNILDGGTTAAGQPFLVMELASGCPIDHYCDDHRLSIDARVKLVSQIAKALGHAHSRGVIHRDLKPTNVLVNGPPGDPTFKIIDFGIAKVLDDRGDDPSLETPRQILGTPLYMSPEQASLNQSDTDASSDVYSLAVILFKLTTGSTPFEASNRRKNCSLADVLSAVVNVEPPQPSQFVIQNQKLDSLAEQRGTSSENLVLRMSGDLDGITLAALAKDKKNRYQSSKAFSDELDRFLNTQPAPGHGDLAESLEMAPQSESLHRRIGMALIRVGRTVEAVDYFETVREALPNEFASQHDLGVALHHAKRYEEAVECYDLALEIKSDDRVAIDARQLAMERVQLDGREN